MTLAISGLAESMSALMSVKFGDSRFNSSRILDSLPTGPVVRTFVLYLIALFNRPEAASDVISGMSVYQTGPDVLVKLGDSRSNRSWDIWATHFVMDDEWRQATEVIAIQRFALSDYETNTINSTLIFRPPVLVHGWPIPIALSLCRLSSATFCIVSKRCTIGL